MKRACAIIVIILIKVVAYAQKAETNGLPDSILAVGFKVSNEVNKMDKRFVRFFERTSRESLKMVNPKDTFNFSDLKTAAPHNKRLIFLGEGTGKINLIVYQQGGNAQQCFCLIYKENKKRCSYQLIRLNEFVKTIQELKEAVSQDRFNAFAYYPK
jgi:hypothetical protein